MVGIIENNTNHTPFALSFTKNGDGIYVDEIVRLTFDCSNFIVPIYGSSYCENMLLFFTITYQGEDLYGIEKVDQSGHALVSSSEQAFAILDENVKEFSGGRIIVSNKGSAKAIKVLYLGDYEIGQDNLLYADNIWLSKNGNYLIQKLNGAFKIYNCHKKNTFTEFEEGYLNLINQETATDFEFVGDKIIVFTNSETEPIYSVTIKKNMTRVDNISGDNISATYLQYNPLGSNSEQGVMTTLTLSFNDDEGTTSASNNGE